MYKIMGWSLSLSLSFFQGTVRFQDELSHEANAGLQKILPILEKVKGGHPIISYADLYTLAGAVR